MTEYHEGLEGGCILQEELLYMDLWAECCYFILRLCLSHHLWFSSFSSGPHETFNFCIRLLHNDRVCTVMWLLDNGGTHVVADSDSSDCHCLRPTSAGHSC